jgi:hypothetical protein
MSYSPVQYIKARACKHQRSVQYGGLHHAHVVFLRCIGTYTYTSYSSCAQLYIGLRFVY